MKSSSVKLFMFITIAGGLLFAACKKGNEYYVNPNTPTDGTVQTLLPALEVSTINVYEGDLARTSNLLVQYHAGVREQASQVNVYSLPENMFDNQWGQLYQAVNTGRVLVGKAASSPRYRGIAKVFLALNWGLLTDFWGDIPYAEAVQWPTNKFPHYDPQQQVLDSIQQLLSDAIADLQTAPGDNLYIPAQDDIIFKGDNAAWIRTAWTLKARYLNRLSNKPTYNPAAILDALSKGISSNAQDCMGRHGTGASESNQWFVFQAQRGYYRAAKPFVDSVALRPADQRLSKYFSPVTGGAVVGSPLDVPSANASLWGPYLSGSIDASTPLVTNFEALFIKAEVLARQGDIATADTLNKAIKASCAKVTGGAYDGASIALYTPAATDINRVMYEKWIAMFGQCEAYNDYRRTGLPALVPNPNGITEGHQIPKRYPTPAGERTANPNAPLPSILASVWWAE